MKKWSSIAEDNGDLFPISLLFESLYEIFEPLLGIEVDGWILGGKNQQWELLMNMEKWDTTATALYDRIKKDKGFLKKIRENTIEGCRKMIGVSEKIHQTDLSKLSNQELWSLFHQYRKKDKTMYIWGAIPVIIDFEITRLSDEVQKIIEKRISDKALAAEYFVALTTPEDENLMHEEERSFLNLVKLKATGGDFEKALDKHTKNFGFFGYCYLGPAWTREHYLERINNFNKDPEERLNQLQEKKEALKKKKQEIIAKLNLTEDELYLIKTIQEFGFLKVYRKDLQYKSYYHMHGWLEEVAKRFDLTVTQLRHMISYEIENMLINNEMTDKNILDERVGFYLYILDGGRLYLMSGDKAREFYNKTVERVETEGIDELKGNCSCQGNASGIVRLIRTVEDMKKMNHGDILISPATNPNLVPAMEKAAAIVTDEGGITCHAAIVSREMGIPCVTGTKLVTKAFKDGDRVEVDATHGIIRRLK